MELRPENIARFCRQLRLRSAVWFAVSTFVALLAMASLFFMFLNIFVEDWAPDARPADPVFTAMLCGFAGGVLPLVAAAVGIGLGVREVRRAAALEDLLGLFPGGARFDLAALQAKLGPARAQRAYVDALGRGGLVDPGRAHLPATEPTPLFGGPSPALPSSPPALMPPTVPSVRPDPLAHTTPSLFPTNQPPPKHAPIALPPAPIPSPVAVPVVTGASSHGASAPVPSASGARTPAPGDVTGRTLKGTWFVEKQLAAGGMGAVYACRHVRTGRTYAVKTMLPDERVSAEALHRFEREAKAASAIGHAGIIAVHDFDVTEDGVHFIVMDLLEGETLEQRLARMGRLPWPEAKRIALQIAEALTAAHAAGILHRDLKPSNVFMSQRPGRPERAVLVDFGLAKPIREGGSVWVTRTGAIVGTAHYMSPEQARGERVDVRADVYGLGALLYEMVAGVPPFLGATAFAVLTMLLTEQAVAPSQLAVGLPPRLDALVLKAIAKGVGDRYPDVASLAAELAQIDG